MKILTIAIPSYNRRNILRKSLESLIPQLLPYKDKIELILSDDGSSDGTFDLMEEFRVIYSHLDIITNRQEVNTGFYGNFRKCRELSTGENLWILSDNEHLLPGCIDQVMAGYDKPGHLMTFLDNRPWFYTGDTKVDKLCFYEMLFQGWSYKVTLTSNVIFPNMKVQDEELFESFRGNIFFGLILMFAGIGEFTTVRRIRGKLYESIPCKPWVGFVDAFTSHILDAIRFACKEGTLDNRTRGLFVKSILDNVFYERILWEDRSVPGWMDKYFSLINYYTDQELKAIESVLFASKVKLWVLQTVYKLKRIAIHKKIWATIKL